METPLRKARETCGQTIRDVAKATDLDPGNLSKLERGLMSASPEAAAKLAKHFHGHITEMQILYPERYMLVAQAEV